MLYGEMLKKISWIIGDGPSDTRMEAPNDLNGGSKRHELLLGYYFKLNFLVCTTIFCNFVALIENLLI